ncbi:MAG: response regulator, partial [Pseudomonadota bacterium]
LMVEGWGAEVLHVTTADEALQLLSEIDLTPDAMLLDYQLGSGLSGTDLYRSIAAKYGAVPTAIVSADRTRELRRACGELRLALVQKPIDKHRLSGFLTGVRKGAQSVAPFCQTVPPSEPSSSTIS